MQYLLFTGSTGYTEIYGALTNDQTNDLIAQFGLAVGSYAIVPNLDSLPTGWQDYQWGVTFSSPSTVNFDLSLAKDQAKLNTSVTYTTKTNNTASSVPSLMLASQMALPEVDRLPSVNQVINQLNVQALQMQSVYDAIDAATSIEELNEIQTPPTGIINTGRGLVDILDLNPSYYIEFNSSNISASDTELFVPGTSTVIPYLPDQPEAPYCFDSLGDCFVSGDYRIQIRVVSTGVILTEFEVPVAPATNVNISF